MKLPPEWSEVLSVLTLLGTVYLGVLEYRNKRREVENAKTKTDKVDEPIAKSTVNGATADAAKRIIDASDAGWNTLERRIFYLEGLTKRIPELEAQVARIPSLERENRELTDKLEQSNRERDALQVRVQELEQRLESLSSRTPPTTSDGMDSPSKVM